MKCVRYHDIQTGVLPVFLSSVVVERLEVFSPGEKTPPVVKKAGDTGNFVV